MFIYFFYCAALYLFSLMTSFQDQHLETDETEVGALFPHRFQLAKRAENTVAHLTGQA